MKYIADLSKKSRLVITHGNGPQVGNILIRVESALGKAYSLPLSICVAESEGEMGYMIEQTLHNELHGRQPVVSVLTQVLVNKKDPAFKRPTKPIGPFYSKIRAQVLRKKFPMIEDAGRGWRRVVASPKPLKIVESETIEKLIKNNIIVIAAGGGGIPVFLKKGRLHGIDAVIDKDLASACLANSINANELILLTGEKYVYLNYGKKQQKPIKKMNAKQAKHFMKQGHFAEGSMKPKIEAAVLFLEKGKGKKVLITAPDFLGRGGTIITK
jgi:carbamate kinase